MTLTMTDLFAGAGGSSTGAVSSGTVDVRLAANHWAKAVEVHNANHPGADHLCADISQYDPRRVRRTDLLWASPECFTAGHLVTTSRGQVPIELVEVGDLVLTHERRWRPVTRVQSRESSSLVLAKGQGHPGIVTTASHCFWARASDLKWHNDIRQYRREYQEPDWIRAENLSTANALWATPVLAAPLATADLPPVFRESDNGWWLLGRWLGDGSLSFGRNHEVAIACGYHEADELAPLLAGTGFRWHRSDKRTAVVFTASCLESRDWLLSWCGHGAAIKQVPPWATSLAEDDREAILQGYMSADGGTTQRRHRVSTVSRALAISVRLLAESLGHRVALAYDKRTTYSIEGRSGVAKRQWVLHWEPALNPKRSPEAYEWAGMAWSRVRSVIPVPGTEIVYNIEVHEDHSYVLDGIVVKNCTHHSQAKGSKRPAQTGPDLLGETLPDEAAERSRATMWDVVRFTEAHRYEAVIVENVVEATKWEPFRAWLLAMDSLGYDHQIVSLNSMHAQAGGLPAPQSRDRLYVVFHRKGNRRPEVEKIQRPAAYCHRCDVVVEARQAFKTGRTVGRYRAQYVYVCPDCGTTVEPGWLPAAAAIDWTIPGTRIGDRAKPLADKTRARIAAGIARYWGEPFAVERRHEYRTRALDEALATLTANETSRALAVPVEGREGKEARPMSEALRTMTTRLETALVAAPFIAELRGGGSTARSTTDPLATVTAAGNHHGLVTPYYGRSATAHPTDRALGTLTTVDKYALVMRNNGGGAEMTTPTAEYLRTLTTAGHQSLVTPGDIEAAEAMVDDCLFRMLEPHEVAAGMAFPSDYLWSGTRRERVRLAGNAVTPPAARDLITAVAESLGAAA